MKTELLPIQKGVLNRKKTPYAKRISRSPLFRHGQGGEEGRLLLGEGSPARGGSENVLKSFSIISKGAGREGMMGTLHEIEEKALHATERARRGGLSSSPSWGTLHNSIKKTTSTEGEKSRRGLQENSKIRA